MFEEQNETLEMRRLQFSINAVERMRDSMNNFFFLKISLQIENVVAQANDFAVLRFSNSPRQQIYLAWILRKIGRDLLAQKSIGQIGNLQTTLDCVVVGNCDKIHPA